MKPQITPPLELIQEWACMLEHRSDADVFTKAVQWGSDQELEACCADIHTVYGKGQADWLRSMRRPKPPSLKKQALALLEVEHGLNVEDLDLLLRALEALPND